MKGFKKMARSATQKIYGQGGGGGGGSSNGKKPSSPGYKPPMPSTCGVRG